MGDALDRVFNAMGKIIHWIDVVLIAGVMVLRFFDAIDRWIAQV